ncbi:MAG: formyltetrahydrofolate deformylase [Bacteroidetes bacterium]|nr:formyltetrahydrofolate deformylase [Bacteroidota bacterium]MBU1116975.1 formyltetrahydrofolate deformylase [Bacteroidota bacterium]MBU1799042.1 formyltetrahydrofolate deformylase [Bacteroidota bacterium]
MTAVLLLSCSDQKGLVASISNFISDIDGNIINLAEHVDSDEKMFFIRIEWKMDELQYSHDELSAKFKPLAEKINAKWRIELAEKKHKIAIFVSKYDHVLQEILWRHKLGEFNTEICSIISNHNDLETLAKNYNIPFHHFPINDQNKLEQEQNEIDLLRKLDVDIIVLARYMQILSSKFVSQFPNIIINIHHSFLPAFMGGNPYKQAFMRGVKMIGATSHFVTNDLDEGPIIAQDIIRISHKDSVKDLVRKGRDLERLVLAKALHLHLEHRVLVHKGKTIVFE